ncbi:MAG: RNA polymerase sigma-70 factor [Tannerellaceae bacterium]|nr:RNA polymerase sigma-70 factor [Tannerellaceae bacterium]
MKKTTYTDEELLKALSHDDLQAFDRLFRNYFPKLKRFLAGFSGNETMAEDLAQDVFVKLWQNRTSLSHIRNLNAYLYTMARNALYNQLELSYYSHTLSEEHIPEIPTLESLEELLFADELEEIIRHTVEHMPPQRKMIFNLSRVEGLKNEEIATRLQIGKRTVETHISAALKELRKALAIFSLFF